MINLTAWLTRLAAAMNRTPRRETLEIYRQELERWDLTETQWERALERIIAHEDGWPSLSVIFGHLRAALGGSTERTALWQTSRDAEGRTFARRVGSCDSKPGPHDYDKWRNEAVQPERDRPISRAAHSAASGNTKSRDSLFASLGAEAGKRQK